LKSIKSISAKKISRRTITLSILNLEDYEPKTISNYINLSFKIPYNTWNQPTGFSIFRSCINDSKEPYNSIKRIAYNPNPDYIERANLKGKKIGYASQSLEISAIENCQYACKTTKQRIYYLTIGEWEIKRDLNSIIICHSNKALNAGTDLRIAYNALLEREKSKRTRKEVRIWNLKNRFFAEQFSKSRIKHENDYLFSALYSNTVFKSKKANIDCIIYPSVAYKYKGFNYAFKTQLIDEGLLALKAAYHVRIDFKQKVFRYPKDIVILNTTSHFRNDVIIWDNK